MTRVSKKKLHPDTEKRISNGLVLSIAEARTRKEAATLIDELLTKTERLMLAKRFAIIALLARGYSFEQIIELLNVSSSTITLIWRGYKQGHYTHIVHHARKHPQKITKDSLLCMLEDFTKIMPPYVGKGRYNTMK